MTAVKCSLALARWCRVWRMFLKRSRSSNASWKHWRPVALQTRWSSSTTKRSGTTPSFTVRPSETSHIPVRLKPGNTTRQKLVPPEAETDTSRGPDSGGPSAPEGEEKLLKRLQVVWRRTSLVWAPGVNRLNMTSQDRRSINQVQFPTKTSSVQQSHRICSITQTVYIYCSITGLLCHRRDHVCSYCSL